MKTNIDTQHIMQLALKHGVSMTPGMANEFIARNREKIENSMEAFFDELIGRMVGGN